MKPISARPPLLLTGLVGGFLIAGAITTAIAQFTSPPDSHGVMFLANHHQEITFSLSAGGSETFFVPKPNSPVRYEISAIGGHPQFPGMKTFIIIYDAGRNITAYYDLLSSGGPNLLASSTNPAPAAQPFDFACAEIQIGLGGRVTITRISQNSGGDCLSLTDPVRFSVNVWD